jgi:hypothetical protein
MIAGRIGVRPTHLINRVQQRQRVKIVGNHQLKNHVEEIKTAA